MRKTYKAAVQDLRFNKARSLVVILALILVISFPIALLNVSSNLNDIIEREEDQYQLAHYNFFFADRVDSNVASKLKTWSADYLIVDPNLITIEGRVQVNAKTQSQGKGDLEKGSWLDIDLISLEPQNLPTINQLVLDKGRYPQSSNEVSLLSSLAKVEGLNIGDSVFVFGPSGRVVYEIVGFVQAIEYASFELSQTGSIYLTYEGLSRYFGETINGSKFNSFPIHFAFEISVDQLRDLYHYLAKMLDEDKSIEEPLVFVWFTRETSFRKGMQDALSITDKYLIAASLFIFLVAGVIIFVTMNRYINEQKTTIGAMYSYGVRKREIIYSFFVRIFLLSLLAVIIGMFLAQVILRYLVGQLVEKWGLISISDSIQTSTVIITFTGAAIISYGFTLLAIANLIRLTPYEAMRGKSSELKSRGLMFALSNILPTKVLRFSAKNLTRNRTRSILTIIAFMLSLSFSGSLIFTDSSISTTIDNYYEDRIFYDLEVDVGFENANNATIVDSIFALDTNSNGKSDVMSIEPYVLTFIPFAEEPEKLTFLMGVQRNTTMFDISPSTISEGRWFNLNTNEIVISRYIAGTFGVNIGDDIGFLLFGKQLNMTVTGVTNELMVSSSIIADLSFLTSIYEAELPFPIPNYIFANSFLIQLEDDVDVDYAQKVLNEENSDIEVSLTKDFYKRRMNALSDSQVAIIYLLIILGLVVGVVAVFTTILISIAERERELGLLNVYGYKKREIRTQLLMEGLIIGVLSLIPGLLLSVLISEKLWITIISESFFEITSSYSIFDIFVLTTFTTVSIIISVIVSYMMTTRRGMVEAIREE